MAVKGREERSIMWTATKLEDIPKNVSWSEDGTNPILGLIFRMYYDNDKKITYLLDVKDDVTYTVPYGAKAKGYTLAYKLFIKT
jgi:hypothetical protein